MCIISNTFERKMESLAILQDKLMEITAVVGLTGITAILFWKRKQLHLQLQVRSNSSKALDLENTKLLVENQKLSDALAHMKQQSQELGKELVLRR